jgi:toxin-antitoxin system PIN domain toxin
MGDHSFHEPARRWLTNTMRATRPGARLVILPMVASGYLRIATNPRIFATPAQALDALGFLRQLLALPRVTFLPLGPEWPLFEDLCIQEELSGNQIPDAWIAATVLYHGEHLATFDRGFRRYLLQDNN